MPSIAEHSAILIVAEEAIAAALAKECRTSSGPSIDVFTAASRAEAFELLRQRHIRLVVADLQAQGLGGFELLAQMVREFPGLPVIVLAAFDPSSIEVQVASAPAIAYLEKPIDDRRLRALIAAQLGPSAAGRLQGVSVASFLQLLEMERTTCTLELVWGGRVGKLYFDAGSLIDAEYGELLGEAAAYAILEAPGTPEITIDGRCRSRPRRIESPLTHLLLDAARIRDEVGREENLRLFESWGAPGPGPQPEAAWSALDRLGREVMRGSFVRLRALDGHLGTCIFDRETGSCVQDHGAPAGLDLTPAAQRQAAALRAELAAYDGPSNGTLLEEMVVTFSQRLYLLRPIAATDALVLLLALDRQTANLAMARLELREVERTLGSAAGAPALH